MSWFWAGMAALAAGGAILFDAMMPIRFVCWFSARAWELHDWPVRRGGDGTPTHFYTYRCWRCGRHFQI